MPTHRRRVSSMGHSCADQKPFFTAWIPGLSGDQDERRDPAQPPNPQEIHLVINREPVTGVCLRQQGRLLRLPGRKAWLLHAQFSWADPFGCHWDLGRFVGVVESSAAASMRDRLRVMGNAAKPGALQAHRVHRNGGVRRFALDKVGAEWIRPYRFASGLGKSGRWNHKSD